jgi:hypothetical protein
VNNGPWNLPRVLQRPLKLTVDSCAAEHDPSKIHHAFTADATQKVSKMHMEGVGRTNDLERKAVCRHREASSGVEGVFGDLFNDAKWH